jgi:hypothetical protein
MMWVPFAIGFLAGCVILAGIGFAYLVVGAPGFVQFCVWLATKLHRNGGTT